MNEQISISITVQLDCLSGQLLRARPLGPWKVQAVGTTWNDVRAKLEARLTRNISTMLPSNLFEGALPDEREHWTTLAELVPQERSIAWSDALVIELDSFRWVLPSGHCVVRIPAVGCVLFGRFDDLTDAEISKQAHVALLRTTENLDLLAIKQRFSNRTFDYKCLRIPLPAGNEQGIAPAVKDQRKKTSALRSAASDLSVAHLQPVYEMDDLVIDLAENFVGENPQSVLLVGPSGVGKSSLVHRMVMMRAELGLGERKIWTTSGARIVSGMSGLGMWQQRCSQLIRQAHATRAIVHFGSLFELLEAGKIDGQPGVASMVRQAISRRHLQAIAECTPEQLALIEREDPVLLRAFTRMELKEPTAAKLTEILRQAATSAHGEALQSDYVFSPQSIEELYRLHSRFATYSALPATALRLMRTMQEESVVGKHPKKSALQTSLNVPRTILAAEDVARAFAKQTGLPRFLVDDSIPLDLEKIERFLSANVIGQTEPVGLLVNLIATMKARLVRPGRPLASLMFIGPTGVGKTEMAKAIARLLYSDSRRMIRIDMSEYASPWAVAKLIGKPGEGDGTLTSPIREQPFSVILLDEFEKADSNVYDMLLQVLGEGRLTDSQGRLADFRNAVVIMTSNLGAESFREANFGFGDSDSASWREHFQREVRKFVRPEFLGRIDRIVPFQPLTREVVRKIAQRELDMLKHRTGLKYSESTLEFEPAAIDLLSEIGYKPIYGARPLRRAIEEHVTVPLANALSELSPDSTWRFSIGAANGAVSIRSERISTKTESIKEVEADVVNSWQQLGAMSRAAKACAPLRNLENELERNQRQNAFVKKKLKAASGPRRIAALKEQLVRGKAAIVIASRLRTMLLDIIGQINQQQLDLMVAWHRNLPIDWMESKAAGKRLLSQLRQATEDVLQGRIAESNLVTLMVTGGGRSQLEVLWRAYKQVADNNRWLLESYIVKLYDPLLDDSSAEYRKRVSEKRTQLGRPTQTQPALRLLSTSENVHGGRDAVCDLFRANSDIEFVQKLANATGFALQFRGDGVGSWLENEHGIIHFFDSNAVGQKRRIRLKVSVFPGRLLSIELPPSWLEPVATPDRDPRRMFTVATQEITDSSQRTVGYAQGKLSEAYVQLIEDEYERALWRAIGYEGVPPEAQLHKQIDVPF